jgi:hypothetical protein
MVSIPSYHINCFIIQMGHFLPSQAMPADHAHIIKATHQFCGWKTIAKMPNNNNPAETIYSSVLIGRNIAEPPQT